MRLFNALLVGLLLTVQFKLWFGDGGIAEMRRVQAMLAEQVTENEGLLERNKALAIEVRDLKHGMDAIEEQARQELGMVGEHEQFFQVVSSQPPPAKH